MKNINKKGISLIVLIITIIVVIILAAVVILTLSKNNPIESAKEAAFKEDIRAYQDELNMYITKEYQTLAGQRDSKITAAGYEKDSTSEEYNNSVYKYLSSFKKKYENKIAIENDEIVYIGRDKKEREWTNNIVKMNPILTVKYVYENGEEAAPTYEETVTDGSYEVDSPIIDGYEPDHYTVSDKIDKDTEITVTYYPWSEGLAYEELTDGTYTVSGIGTFTGENLVIPRKYNGKNVTEIKNGAFFEKKIKILIIPSNVNNVNDSAFRSSGIQYLNLNCKKTSSYFSFAYCLNIKEINIGKNVNSLGGYSFQRCSNLKKVYIYSNVVGVSSQFAECSSLQEIIANKNNQKYKSINGILYTIDGNVLYKYPPGKKEHILVLDNVKNIGESSFSSNNYLTDVEITENCVSVGGYAFDGCNNLKSIKVNSNSIQYPFAIRCANLKSVEIGKNVKSIGSWTFYNCYKIEEFNYLGTKEEWNLINKGDFKLNSSITTIHCTDGEIEL